MDEYSDVSDAESEKVRKAKNLKKQATRSGVVLSLICNLTDEHEARPCLWNIFCNDYHNQDVTGKAKKELEVSKSELHHVLTLHDFADKLSRTIIDRLIANMIVNDSG